VDLETATRHGVVVTTTGSENAAAVAEYTFALLLALARKVLAADSASTLVQKNPDGSSGVVNVYNNRNATNVRYANQQVAGAVVAVGGIFFMWKALA
jgi:lactate dehydrogenase-like 2-hydroxyacid dehydrogenase